MEEEAAAEGTRMKKTLLPARPDAYGGLTVFISSNDTTDVDTFRTHLKDSLSVWTHGGVRGLWLYLPVQRVDLVPVAVKCGFVYHHAQPSYCMLTVWLPRDSPSTLPAYASHYVGVGGLVLSEDGHVLLIQEKFADGHGCWKLPGGHVEPGEDLGDAVCREVLEETGVSVRFGCVLAFRHMHRYNFGSSDIYFVCLARPLTRQLRPCPTEIHACRWVPASELPSYINSTKFHGWLLRVCLDAASSGLVVRPVVRDEGSSSRALVYTAHRDSPHAGTPADPGSPIHPNAGSAIDHNAGSAIDHNAGTPLGSDSVSPVDPHTSITKNSNIQTVRDPNTETGKIPNTRSPLRNPNTDAPPDPGTETPKDPGTETPKDPGTETPKDPGTETPKDPGTETPKDPGTETPKDPNTDTLELSQAQNRAYCTVCAKICKL